MRLFGPLAQGALFLPLPRDYLEHTGSTVLLIEGKGIDAYLDKVLTEQEEKGSSRETQMAVRKLVEHHQDAERAMLERYGSSRLAMRPEFPRTRG
jgi:hypothetical protein